MNAEEEIEARMARLGITEEDLTEKFILGSGCGGQKLQKTSSCVYLRHEPSGIEVKCQKTRSRELNRTYARMELCDRIEDAKRARRREAEKQRHLKAQEKRGRSKKTKRQMIEEKRRRSAKKSLRRRPKPDE